MSERRARPQKPWSRAKAERRVLSPDQEWAAEVERRVLADCHPWQLDAVRDPSVRVSLLVGRGGGKTTTMRARALIKLTRIRKAKIVYVATTRPQAEELNWGPLKDLIEAIGASSEFEFNESKLRCTCKRTGSTYRMIGADDQKEVDKLRGQPFDEVQVDESASFLAKLLENLIDRAVGPRLGERNGALLLGGTPGHILQGPFYDATRRGSEFHRNYGERELVQYAGWDRWSSHAWTLKDVAELPKAAEVYPAVMKNWIAALAEKKRKGWSDNHPVWRREYLGEWSSDDTDSVFKYRPHLEDGTPWNRWNPERVGPLKFGKLPEERKDWNFAYSHDMGHADPYALNIFAFSPSDESRTIYHVYGFERTGMHAKPIAVLLLGEKLDTDKPAGAIGYTGWPVGQIGDIDAATLAELANVYGVKVVKAEKKMDYKFGAIELVNGDLIDGRIKILEGSPLEQQLQTLQWKADEFGTLKEDKAQANHSTDTLVYGRRLIAHMFESGQADASAQQAGSYVDPQGLAPEDRRNNASSEDDNFADLLSDGAFNQDWGG